MANLNERLKFLIDFAKIYSPAIQTFHFMFISINFKHFIMIFARRSLLWLSVWAFTIFPLSVMAYVIGFLKMTNACDNQEDLKSNSPESVALLIVFLIDIFPCLKAVLMYHGFWLSFSNDWTGVLRFLCYLNEHILLY